MLYLSRPSFSGALPLGEGSVDLPASPRPMRGSTTVAEPEARQESGSQFDVEFGTQLKIDLVKHHMNFSD